MRVAIREVMSPANQGTRKRARTRPLAEAGSVSRQFGRQLHQQASAYTGLVDQFGCPGNTVDDWRMEFSRFEAANGTRALRKRQG
jgi:hypothetical protein